MNGMRPPTVEVVRMAEVGSKVELQLEKDDIKQQLWRTARRLNQSIFKEISPEYSLEGLMLKPKF